MSQLAREIAKPRRPLSDANPKRCRLAGAADITDLEVESVVNVTHIATIDRTALENRVDASPTGC